MEGQRAKNKGFTLIELLIVVAVIGVLAAISIPNFMGYRLKAYNSTAVSDLKTVKMMLETYYTSHNYYP